MRWSTLPLDSLKAYPSWLVLICLGIVCGALLAATAKLFRWALVFGLVLVFVLTMSAFALWLLN